LVYGTVEEIRIPNAGWIVIYEKREVLQI
jgi:hypothetical protein